MYTFIIQDIYGNYFYSKKCFDTKEQAEEEMYHMIEYDFVHSVELAKCEDIVGMDLVPTFN